MKSKSCKFAIKGSSLKEVAKDSQLSVNKVHSIRNEPIVERLKEQHPVEISRDFNLSMEQVFFDQATFARIK
ncbi:hypothetical protein B834_1020 [Enterococcus mundtii 1A]|uniref:hypothetical protein n=1 Tax=Enterococcus mundtii TaxID=53346 RepID=UPI0004468E69|nr:hypothetical protein [Enterococcus mundtii]EYT95114.1 hypothetical protein AK89_10075 [Enterococcus mundtii CRL35]MDA9428542.1 hypothetical protein [Enterococcus mundtii 1A]MDO7877975.1 hypothetical protein [Enterococcus mundtii]MEC3940261.1 hypothetical protein [Enterococcus mundtii]